ncbi:MAG TPA: cytochrome c oxidase subunit I [Bdellovibrionales bacterium]|nr:cytochrome c oxidase subunit I [Pseudobdellovibrionaceae bacterium]HAG90962.1 cytochrome c oxidase subunit I [Bdellovibrionales bacterium]|tara:strand:+ start:1150 stop:2733 length:1584 start_codon:yes stop_codon:yes gene_type:complete
MSSAPGVNYLNEKSGLWSWLTTLDHKRIGIMYMISVLSFFAIGGAFAMLIRWELFGAGKNIVDAATYNQFMTFHGAIMTFMVIIPGVPAFLGNFFLPLMIGAKDVAFPRVNLLSWYCLMVGAAISFWSLFYHGADTGWTFYTPYSIQTDNGTTWLVAGAFVMGFSSILTGLNFIVTVHKLRAPGMTFFRMPLFIWGLYSTAVIQVLATPVLGITLLLLIAERTMNIGIFDPAMGGDPVLFQHFFWFYSHPAVYIMILPAMGIISELITCYSKKTIFGYRAIAWSSIGIAAVSFFVWGHHMFVSGQSEVAGIVFSFLTMLVGVPTAIKTFNWVATLYKGSIEFSAPMLFALGFIFLFTIGGVTGIMLAVTAVDVHFHDTYFVVAHFHYVMVGGTLMAITGGIYHWLPKMFGKMYNEGVARFSFVLIFIGFNVTFFPQFVLGAMGMPRRYYDYLPAFEPLNKVSSLGAWTIGVGFLFALYVVVDCILRGKKAPDNPWGAKTLEWQTSSPPPHENFTTQPVVTGGPYEYR